MKAEPPAVDTGDRLVGLIERGFQFMHPTGSDGRLQAVVGVRVHGNVIDLVQLHAENDVTATRMPVGEDIMAPKTVLWQVHGSVADVLDEVLSLPDDAVNDGPGTANGCWLPTRPGSARFFRATA